MNEVTTRSGRCLCGGVRFTAGIGAPEMSVCHCGICRKWSGGTFMAVECRSLAIEDESALGVYRSSDYGERVFCRTCGSSLFWRMQDHSMAVASLQAFDDLSDLPFTSEIFIDEKPPLYDFANDTKKMTGEEFFAAVMAKGA